MRVSLKGKEKTRRDEGQEKGNVGRKGDKVEDVK
jgi:hypothetical protein